MADGWMELAWDPLSATQLAAMAGGRCVGHRRSNPSSSAHVSFFLPSSSSSSSSSLFIFYCHLLLLLLFSYLPGISFDSHIRKDQMSDRKGKSIQYDIVEHEDELQPLCDDGGNVEPKVGADGDSARDDGEGIRRMKGIKKAAKKLLLLPIRKLETPDGQTTRRKKKKKKKTNGNQTRWPSSHPPPPSHSYSFEGSTKACCLSLGWNHPRSPIDAIKKPSKNQIFLKSFIERNDFYCKECDVHLR